MWTSEVICQTTVQTFNTGLSWFTTNHSYKLLILTMLLPHCAVFVSYTMDLGMFSPEALLIRLHHFNLGPFPRPFFPGCLPTIWTVREEWATGSELKYKTVEYRSQPVKQSCWVNDHIQLIMCQWLPRVSILTSSQYHCPHHLCQWLLVKCSNTMSSVVLSNRSSSFTMTHTSVQTRCLV